MPANTIKVDRSTRWGNPFIVGQNGTQQECVDMFRFMCAGNMCVSEGYETVERQKQFIANALQNIATLKGKNLACWCELTKPCHADILIEIANQ